jgi:hypothetical protein
MNQVKNMDMLSIGTLVNVLWQWYLPGGSLEKNPLLIEVYAYCMGNNQQETEFTCVAKRTRYVLVWLTVVNICVTYDHGYVSFVVIIILSFIHNFSKGL